MNRYVHGTHNAICDLCGFKFKRKDMLKTWDNLLVCKVDYDPKHPQLTIRVPRETISVKDTRLEDRESTNLHTFTADDIV